MRISDLSRAAGMPVATVKFYLRDGLLQPGRRTAATQAVYGAEHVARLRLIRALTEVGGLSLGRVRDVLAAMNGADLLQAVGTAHAALPPHVPDGVDTTAARELIDRLGWTVEADTPALEQLATALAAAERVGLGLDEETQLAYAEAAASIAAADVANVPTGSHEEAVAYVVLGTALYEPVLLALRRLAQQSFARKAWQPPPGGAALR